MECCNTLQYLEGAAYIAIVLAVIGVPHMLTYYFERRERAADRAAAERQRLDDRAEAERRREEERLEAERQRREDLAERQRREDEAERRRQDERAEADRRHLEMMTALVAIAERNGHPPPAPASDPDASILIAQMQQRIADLENNFQELQNQRNGNGTGNS